MVLDKKLPLFPLCFLGQYGPGKCFLFYYKKKKTPFKIIISRSSKIQKFDIFPKGLTHGFGPKMAIFPSLLFLGNIGQENFFYDILEQKNACLIYKKKNVRKSKNWHFWKVVNPWFWTKKGHYSNFFFLGNIGHQNVFYDNSRTKKRLSRLYKQEVQKVKKLTFFQRG